MGSETGGFIFSIQQLGGCLCVGFSAPHVSVLFCWHAVTRQGSAQPGKHHSTDSYVFRALLDAVVVSWSSSAALGRSTRQDASADTFESTYTSYPRGCDRGGLNPRCVFS